MKTKYKSNRTPKICRYTSKYVTYVKLEYQEKKDNEIEKTFQVIMASIFLK